MAKAHTRELFDAAIKKLQEMKEEAYGYLNVIPHQECALYAFSAPRSGHTTSNVAESLNAAWNEYRSLPVLLLLTSLWVYVMRTMYAKHHQPYRSLCVTNAAKICLDKVYGVNCIVTV